MIVCPSCISFDSACQTCHGKYEVEPTNSVLINNNSIGGVISIQMNPPPKGGIEYIHISQRDLMQNGRAAMIIAGAANRLGLHGMGITQVDTFPTHGGGLDVHIHYASHAVGYPGFPYP